MATFNTTEILVDHFLESLETTYQRMYGGYAPEYPSVIHTAAVMAMEIIANSNALYHNAEHSMMVTLVGMMVTLVGQEIVRGKYLRDGGVSAEEWVHFIVSLLCHDIGYVRGICPGDSDGVAVIDGDGGTVELAPGATDAALTPYHVERGNLFVRWRFRDHPIIDHEVITLNIENTRFPVPAEGDSTEVGDYPRTGARGRPDRSVRRSRLSAQASGAVPRVRGDRRDQAVRLRNARGPSRGLSQFLLEDGE